MLQANSNENVQSVMTKGKSQDLNIAKPRKMGLLPLPRCIFVVSLVKVDQIVEELLGGQGLSSIVMISRSRSFIFNWVRPPPLPPP